MQIIRDTREKFGFEFSMKDVEVISDGLKCGDYTTSILRDKAVIERKASTGELYRNLCTAKTKQRFFRELDKLKKLDFCLIVCEFPRSYLHSFPVLSGMPEFKKGDLGKNLDPWYYVKCSADFLRKTVYEVENYGVKIKFCENRNEAEEFVFQWLKNLEAKYARNVSS